MRGWRGAICVGVGVLALQWGTLCCAAEADSLRPELRPVAKTLEERRDEYFRTGDLLARAGPLESAHAQVLTALRAFEARGDRTGRAQALLQLAKVERSQSTLHPDVMQAAEANTQRRFREALEAARQVDDEGLQIQALSGVAQSLIQGKNLTAALAPTETLVDLAERSGSVKDRMDAFVLRAQLELARGDPAACSDYLARALALETEVHDAYESYFAYSLRVDMEIERAGRCSYEPDYESCARSYQLAIEDLEQQRRIAAGAGYAYLARGAESRRDSYRMIANVYAGQVERGKKLLEMARATYFTDPKVIQALTLTRFAPGHNPDMARALRSYAMQHNGPVNRYNPLPASTEASIAEMEGDDEGALRGYKRAVELLEHDRRTLGDSEGSGTSLAALIDIYYRLALQLLDRKDYAGAFEMLERARARSLAQLLQRSSLGLGDPGDQALFAKSVELRALIGKEQGKIYDNSLTQRVETEEMEPIRKRIDALEAEYRDLTRRLAASPRLHNLVEAPIASLQSVQAAARAGGYEVLYYLVADNSIITWHIAPDAVHVVKVHYGPVLDFRVQQILDSAADPNRTFSASAAQELYMMAVYPVLPHLGSHHLVVVPHDALDPLPFALLQDPADASFLGEKFRISTVPSATILTQLGAAPDLKGGRLLGIATPQLQDSVTEVQSIAALYPGRTRVISDRLVTKPELFAASGDYNLVHLSLHGVFDVREPMLSYLRLAPAGSEGELRAADLFALRLPRNSLVVLSACETGRVEGKRTNEALGMVRGLLYAGASALVLSSWKVDAASTQLWMETFYREAQSRPLAEAAWRASAAVREHPEFRHPFYWAPFQLTGA
jgi:CHAT domain-containing protein